MNKFDQLEKFNKDIKETQTRVVNLEESVKFYKERVEFAQGLTDKEIEDAFNLHLKQRTELNEKKQMLEVYRQHKASLEDEIAAELRQQNEEWENNKLRQAETEHVQTESRGFFSRIGKWFKRTFGGAQVNNAQIQATTQATTQTVVQEQAEEDMNAYYESVIYEKETYQNSLQKIHVPTQMLAKYNELQTQIKEGKIDENNLTDKQSQLIKVYRLYDLRVNSSKEEYEAALKATNSRLDDEGFVNYLMIYNDSVCIQNAEQLCDEILEEHSIDKRMLSPFMIGVNMNADDSSYASEEDRLNDRANKLMVYEYILHDEERFATIHAHIMEFFEYHFQKDWFDLENYEGKKSALFVSMLNEFSQRGMVFQNLMDDHERNDKYFNQLNEKNMNTLKTITVGFGTAMGELLKLYGRKHGFTPYNGGRLYTDDELTAFDKTSEDELYKLIRVEIDKAIDALDNEYVPGYHKTSNK